MKALKEKRISLRSLWRRGLVILSLFALVFASCGDSSSGGDSSVSDGKRIVKVELLTGPTVDQYLGRPVDLEGVTVLAWYSDGTKSDPIEVKGRDDFVPWPRVVTGYYLPTSNGKETVWGAAGFVPMDSFLLTYSNGASIDAVSVSLKKNKVWAIVRTNTTSNTGASRGYDLVTDHSGSYEIGLHVTGYEDMAKRAYYVDEDIADFSGLRMEADYVYYDQVADKTYRDRKGINFSDVTWEIVPDYDSGWGRNDDGSSRGFLNITAGDFLGWAGSLSTISSFVPNTTATGEGLVPSLPANVNGYGITVALPLDKVYTVSGISVNKEGKDLGEYFFWKPNTREAWVDRLDDAILTVDYYGGETRTLAIKDLAKNQRIWYNANPSEGGPTEQSQSKIDYDFDVVPVQYPLTVKGNKDPKITLYYRGKTCDIPVNVFTKLEGVSVVSKDGSDIVFNPIAKRDNDVDYGLPGSKGLAERLIVTATYSAYNDSSATAEVPLTYIGDLARLWKYDLNYKAQKARGEYIPFYEFASDDASYAKGYSKWLTQYQKGAKGKDSIKQNITVTHRVDFEPLTATTYLDGSSIGYTAEFPCWLGGDQFQYEKDPSAVTNPDGDDDVMWKPTNKWYASYPGISSYAWLTDGTYWPDLNGNGSQDLPSEYDRDIPNFTGNYTRKGWVWTDEAKASANANSGVVLADGTANGSGLKQAKLKKDASSITWQVKGDL